MAESLGAFSVACAPRRTRDRGLLVALAAVWRVLRWPWIAVALVALALVADRAFFGARLPVTQSLTVAVERGDVRLLGALAAAALLALVSSYGLLAQAYLGRKRRRALVSDYVLLPVKRLDPRDFVPRYVEEVYVPRRDAADGSDADARASVQAHAAAHRGGHTGERMLGVCIFGASGQGKTRLAWEVARAELSDAILLAWPHDPTIPLDFARLNGRKVLLWLDDLHEYATATEGAAVSDLPRRLAAAGAQVVVLATCRDGADERRARRHVGGLLTMLEPVRLAPLTGPEADTLVAALRKEYVQARRDLFDGTPGSILLGVRRLRDERFPRLPLDAKRLLWAVALLRSAGIYAYPMWRVRLVAVEVMGMPPRGWREALGAACREGYLRVRRSGSADEGRLEPVSAAYLDNAVPSHLTANAEASDDWMALQSVFERHRDVYGLLRLGASYAEVAKGIGPLLPYSLRQEKQRGILCIRTALEQCSLRSRAEDWAMAQIELGDALWSRAALTEGILRADFLGQAAGAYTAAGDVLERESRQAHWALARLRLGLVCERIATDALFAGDTLAAVERYREAALHAADALSIYEPAYDAVRHQEAEALRARVMETLCAVAAC